MPIEITWSAGDTGGDNGAGEEFSGTCVEETWTKPKGVGSRGGGGDGWGRGEWWEKMETVVLEQQ